MGATKDDARAQKTRAAAVFGLVGEVVGVGITRVNSGYGLKVNLREEPAAGVEVPQDVNGVPVRVEVSGPIRKR